LCAMSSGRCNDKDTLTVGLDELRGQRQSKWQWKGNAAAISLTYPINQRHAFMG